MAATHYRIEPALVSIIYYSGDPAVEALDTEPIRLVEVNAATIACGVLPLHFRPTPASGIPFPYTIIDVTPAEYKKIQSNQLELPKGWTNPQSLPRGFAESPEESVIPIRSAKVVDESMTTDSAILPVVPSSTYIQRLLAIVVAEADLLRAQLQLSLCLERERERLRS